MSHEKDYYKMPTRDQMVKRGMKLAKGKWDGTAFSLEVDINEEFDQWDELNLTKMGEWPSVKQSRQKYPVYFDTYTTRQMRDRPPTTAPIVFPKLVQPDGSTSKDDTQMCLSFPGKADIFKYKTKPYFSDIKSTRDTDVLAAVKKQIGRVPTIADMCNGLGYEWRDMYTGFGLANVLEGAANWANYRTVQQDIYWVNFSNTHVPAFKQLRCFKKQAELLNIPMWWCDSCLYTTDIKTTMGYAYEFYWVVGVSGKASDSRGTQGTILTESYREPWVKTKQEEPDPILIYDDYNPRVATD
jgi:hypothetical protein